MQFLVLELENGWLLQIEDFHLIFTKLHIGLTSAILACLVLINHRLGAR